MSKPLKFKSGDHWVECQRCGRIVRESAARKEWTGLIVCPEDWEPRHPQDFVRAIPDYQAAKGLVNPESSDTFVAAVCSTRSGVAGVAVAGCAIAGLDTDYNEIPSGTFNTSTL